MKYSECFVFDDGSLTIRTSGPWSQPGSGWLCFPQDALEPEQDDETGKDYWVANLQKSELIFLRDTLNTIFPIATPPASASQVEAAATAVIARWDGTAKEPLVALMDDLRAALRAERPTPMEAPDAL